jgi:response regulator RpfG family c-di-GMP phosphodiesterase
VNDEATILAVDDTPESLALLIKMLSTLKDQKRAQEQPATRARRQAAIADLVQLALTGAELSVLMDTAPRHPQPAHDLLAPITYLRPTIDIPYCHHERWDGTGYARGLAGEQIPLVARLFAVVDVWDALRSDRPYRARWTEDKAFEHIRSSAGTHFDPKTVELFFRIVDDKAPREVEL